MVYHSSKFKQFLTPLLPGICFLCHDAAPDLTSICDDCRDDLPVLKSSCIRCGVWLPTAGTCNQCFRRPPVSDQMIAPLRYVFPNNELIKQLKYKYKVLLAQALGHVLSTHIKKVSANSPDCILPVPLHSARYLSRGFNQADEIARVVSNHLAVPVDAKLLRRARHTLAQHQLSPKARKRNVKGAFDLTMAPAYKHVAIIDDLVTTGATVNEIAGLVKAAGVKRVDIWACARAESL